MIFEGVDRALRLELQRSWEASDRGRMLYEVLPRVGREWQPLDIDRVPRRGVTLVARFLTGHCHLCGSLRSILVLYGHQYFSTVLSTL